MSTESPTTTPSTPDKATEDPEVKRFAFQPRNTTGTGTVPDLLGLESDPRELPPIPEVGKTFIDPLLVSNYADSHFCGDRIDFSLMHPDLANAVDNEIRRCDALRAPVEDPFLQVAEDGPFEEFTFYVDGVGRLAVWNILREATLKQVVSRAAYLGGFVGAANPDRTPNVHEAMADLQDAMQVYSGIWDAKCIEEA